MKRFSMVFMVLLLLTCIVSLGWASFDIPGHVYRIGDLVQAQEEAKADGKPIVFLYSNEDTDCPLAAGASINIMRKFEQSAVTVYVCRDDWAEIPLIVKHAINSPASGEFIPKTVVVDSDIKRVVSIIPYQRPWK